MVANSSSRPIVLEPIDRDSSYVDGLVLALSEYLSQMEIDADSDSLRSCVLHLLYVEQVNRYINLTRITDIDEAIVLHILDSLCFLPYVPRSASRLLDMGSGAGFPGVPIHLASGIHATLLDSVAKKMKAVDAICSELGCSNVDCVADRLETYASDHLHSFDVLTARALASLPILVEYATPLLKKNGTLIISKGVPDADEISSGMKAASICGLELVSQSDFELPDNLGHRVIFVFKAVSKSKVKLPRQNGLARKNPLA